MKAWKGDSVFSAMYRSLNIRQINVMYDAIVVHVDEAMPHSPISTRVLLNDQ
jgi:hypothetical protein